MAFNGKKSMSNQRRKSVRKVHILRIFFTSIFHTNVWFGLHSNLLRWIVLYIILLLCLFGSLKTDFLAVFFPSWRRNVLLHSQVLHTPILLRKILNTFSFTSEQCSQEIFELLRKKLKPNEIYRFKCNIKMNIVQNATSVDVFVFCSQQSIWMPH